MADGDVVCLSAEFEGSFPTYDILPPPECLEFAIVGRSNVGKSSLLNLLTNRKSLARVGKTPGVTRQINFFRTVFRIDGTKVEIRIADLPGYGFANVPAAEQKRWGKELDKYLSNRETLALLLLLVAGRRDLREEEEYFLSEHYSFPKWVIGTKRDQILRRETPSWLPEMNRRELPVHLVSSNKRIGIEELRREISKFFLSAE